MKEQARQGADRRSRPDRSQTIEPIEKALNGLTNRTDESGKSVARNQSITVCPFSGCVKSASDSAWRCIIVPVAPSSTSILSFTLSVMSLYAIDSFFLLVLRNKFPRKRKFTSFLINMVGCGHGRFDIYISYLLTFCQDPPFVNRNRSVGRGIRW